MDEIKLNIKDIIKAPNQKIRDDLINKLCNHLRELLGHSVSYNNFINKRKDEILNLFKDIK